MTDRLDELLATERTLYGVLCRDSTVTDIELMRAAGYHVVWLDLEHGGLSLGQVLALARTTEHLGLVSCVRIPELAKGYVQPLLDQGVRVIVLPDVESAAQAEAFVRLGRFPPAGRRGASSATAWSDYAGSDEVARRIRSGDDAAHLMVQFESDTSFSELDPILSVPGIDMVTVGPLDWRLRTPAADERKLRDKVEQVIARATQRGKVTAMLIDDPAGAEHYRKAGLRIVFVGIDVALKSRVYSDTLERFRASDR